MRERLGYDLVSWRAHSYKVDANTYELLASHGLRLVSDDVEPDTVWPKHIEHGLVSHPMNTVPDHDHLYHAHRTESYVEEANRKGYGADDFGAVSYTIEDWGELVTDQALAIDRQGGVATILAHPLCMHLADEFSVFERILERLADLTTIWARDILDLQEGTVR